MAYLLKPDPTDIKGQSQAVLKTNFTAIKTLIDVNHVTFDAVGEGKHKQLNLPTQAAAPSTAAAEFALYTIGAGAAAALTLRKPSDGAEIDLTTVPTVSTTLSNGLIIKWGTGSMGAGVNTSAAIVFATQFPTGVFSCQVTPYGTPTGDMRDYVLMPTLTQTQVIVRRDQTFGYTGTAVNFYYLALGY